MFAAETNQGRITDSLPPFEAEHDGVKRSCRIQSYLVTEATGSFDIGTVDLLIAPCSTLDNDWNGSVMHQTPVNVLQPFPFGLEYQPAKAMLEHRGNFESNHGM